MIGRAGARVLRTFGQRGAMWRPQDSAACFQLSSFRPYSKELYDSWSPPQCNSLKDDVRAPPSSGLLTFRSLTATPTLAWESVRQYGHAVLQQQGDGPVRGRRQQGEAEVQGRDARQEAGRGKHRRGEGRRPDGPLGVQRPDRRALPPGGRATGHPGRGSPAREQALPEGGAGARGVDKRKAQRRKEERGGEWVPRPPVVTVMGHVDHGKTSLLDALRNTSVAAGEAGGITQHIGAFVVGLRSGQSLTFLDTPGHAAFAAMRARGAAVTDIVVLVVAADDGVMPQTLESIQHAREAGVPLVVAITKCDREDARPERVEQQLLAEGLELEDVGGDVQVVRVSARTGQGLESLEEAVLLQAELMGLTGRRGGAGAEGTVVEARMGRGQGPVATVIVRGGELKTGAHVVAGRQWGKVRSLRDWSGGTVKSAGPSMPVEIDGLKGLPEAGDEFVQVASEDEARRMSAERQDAAQQDRLSAAPPSAVRSAGRAGGVVTGQPGGQAVEESQGEGEGEASGEVEEAVREVVLVVKADVQGSVEAVCSALGCLSCSQAHVRVVHSSVGAITQSDVDMADATGAAAIVGFNVKPMSGAVEAAARTAGVQLSIHRVIYRLLEEVGQMVVDAAPGVARDTVTGQAQVAALFPVQPPSRGRGRGRSREADEGKADEQHIAGCRVTSGTVVKGGTMRVVRSGEVVYHGRCASLRREKDDVDKAVAGMACGLMADGFGGFVVGDIVEFLTPEIQKPRLVSLPNGGMYIDTSR